MKDVLSEFGLLLREFALCLLSFGVFLAALALALHLWGEPHRQAEEAAARAWVRYGLPLSRHGGEP